ncbi:protein Wnt-6-like [Clupea harengus]|uniref:Protein Wnt n=1 Tax=Clupea harengus TaxID=7950 RepID=A0A8M1K996_CLUHA|nr:protein Wnt-6-like [Clupea harengus]
MMLLARINLTLAFILLSPVSILRLWWVLGSPLVMDHNSICRKTRRLGGKHAELCQSQPEIVQEVVKGARLGMRECQHQFRHHRWNCTNQSRSLGKILQQDIREAAFLYAITAAGVVHTVTQACSMGDLLQCGCTPATQEGPWEWGGCGDDVEFGYQISRQFTDSRRKRGKSDIKTLIDLHNNEAGRLAVQGFMRMECKCHGLSGSCTLRSCWRKMPLFRQTGDWLVQRFQSAVQVMGSNNGKSLIPLRQDAPPLEPHDLIYFAESPDFCLANRRLGSEGTRGRVCNGTTVAAAVGGSGGCESLCCGRGHQEHTLVYEENCVCRFHWCCVVQCQRCSVRRDVSRCL